MTYDEVVQFLEENNGEIWKLPRGALLGWAVPNIDITKMINARG